MAIQRRKLIWVLPVRLTPKRLFHVTRLMHKTEFNPRLMFKADLRQPQVFSLISFLMFYNNNNNNNNNNNKSYI